jgi:ribulose-phosphate 3-epimerase
MVNTMQQKKEIIPAIIAKNQEELNANISKVIDQVDIIQLDIMDNQFVPNTSLYFDFKLPNKSCLYEAHLMVSKPEEWVKKYIAKVDTILIHHESNYNAKSLISTVKEQGKRIGLVLNPETPISEIEAFLNDIDQVLIMTVKPGFYGSPFLPDMIEKISYLRSLKPEIDIEVDGGITDKTIKMVNDAGANMFVSGSYLIKAGDVSASLLSLKKIINSSD